MKLLERLRHLDAEPHRGWRRAAVRCVQYALALADQFAHDKVVIRASGLAYATLLATVPLVAVLFALFTAFASFEDLRGRFQDLLFSQLLPTRQDEISIYISQFTENTNRLGFVGFIFLVITAIMLLDNVESNFNSIWHVTTRRKIISKITAYTSVLIFGTVFLGASLSISARIKAMLFTGKILEIGFITQAWTWFFPLALSLLAFLLMYLVIPFTKVRFRSALIGAVVASVLWEAGKNLFANSVGQSVRYSTIYGSLAVVPIFLIWIYITWIIVLLGLEITFTHQHFASLIRKRLYRVMTGRDRTALAIKVYALIAHRFHAGEPPPTTFEIGEHFEAPMEAVEDRVVERLVEGGLVQRVGAESAGAGLVPTTSLENVRAVQLLRTVIGEPATGERSRHALDRAVDELIDEFQLAGEKEIAEITIRDLLRVADSPEADGSEHAGDEAEPAAAADRAVLR